MKFALVACLFVALVAGCATKATFQPSPVVPAAEAKVKIKRDDNDNAVIRLSVRHLADPSRLTPPRRMYVVWAETPDGRVVNLGRLAVSKKLEGEFLSVTPLERFRLLITAENLATTSIPGRLVVLETEMLTP